jgi:pantoate--beta-alanine ligase
MDFLGREPLAKAEVVAVRDAVTLQSVARITAPVVVALFVRIGTTRLLDNRVIGQHCSTGKEGNQ